jgi:hypothetical protein
MDRHKGQPSISDRADQDERGVGQRRVTIRAGQRIPPEPQQEPRHKLGDSKYCKHKRSGNANNQRPNDLAREMEPLLIRLVHTTSLAET